MIGKIVAGSSFAGTVGYVMKELSRILDTESVTPPETKHRVEDFKCQALLNPQLHYTAGHISLSFLPQDAPLLTDALMTRIAKEYVQRMGITDTQYMLVRHLDQQHPHDGQTLSDKNIEKYGLNRAPGKKSVRRERLREPDKTRYPMRSACRCIIPDNLLHLYLIGCIMNTAKTI